MATRASRRTSLRGAFASAAMVLAAAACRAPAQAADYPPPAPGADPRAKYPDSFKYYGPGGLWEKWTPAQKRGRDTWIFYTGGNQRFYRLFAEELGKADMSVDFFRALDSKNRDKRFADVGLINEPNCRPPREDEIKKTYGLRLDVRENDPLNYYPNDPVYGESTGIVGMRRFPNPKFKPDFEKHPQWGWDRDGYFKAPAKVQPPYLVGISCAFCHVAFDPCNPPKDVNKPRWENLAANIGNQYLREGELFFGRARVTRRNGPPPGDAPKDPYDWPGLDKENLLYQYGHTQITGTSETSRFTYDFINNPTIITPIFNLGNRVNFFETTPTGVRQATFHVLADGADSVGVFYALQRVYTNIGSEGAYLLDHLWNPLTGARQRPIRLKELRGDTPKDENDPTFERRKPEGLHTTAELRRLYGEDFGKYWRETESRILDLAAYLTSYGPMRLADAPGGAKHINAAQAKRGARAFGKACAECHSNRQPHHLMTAAERRQFFIDTAQTDDFRDGNTFADDRRYSAVMLGTNLARALAANATEGDVWAELSSVEYKNQPGLGLVRLKAPVDPRNPIDVQFTAPAGGRGYYRTPNLVSMWATAPYLHNNGLGPEPIDAEGRLDPKYVTVEGRLDLFNRSVRQLLRLDERPPRVLRTTAASGLGLTIGELRRHLPRVLRDALPDLLEDAMAAAARAAAAAHPEAAALVEALRPALRQAVQREAEAVFGAVGEAKDLRDRAAAHVEEKLARWLADGLRQRNVPDAAINAILARLKEHAGGMKARIAEALDAQELMTLPAGTPINLLFNLHAASLPHAVKALIVYRRQPDKLHRELLKLSECPDLVENRGHDFGTPLDPNPDRRLTVEERLELTEFLKTL